MSAHPASHPTDRTLSSYGLGDLDKGSATAVNKHLQQCPDCRARLAEISADRSNEHVQGARESPRQSTFGPSRPRGAPNDAGTRAPAPPAASRLPPGLTDHPDYEITRELGRGGMGIVYLAHNRMMGRDEVLKVMGRELMERPGMLDRFLREIRAVAKLRHPNVVTAYYATRLGECVLFAMEYVDGLDLAKFVKSKGPMSVSHACYFARQVALALQHAHEQGLVHRDIKPANLMLTREGKRTIVKVLDFGLAKATREQPIDSRLTGEGQMLGTPECIAPEQIRDAQMADIRADIYSLGCTLYFLLAGQPPFRSEKIWDLYQAHFSIYANPLDLVRREVPPALAALVSKMMAKDPGERFQTPAEVAQALTPFVKSGPMKAEPTQTEPADVRGPIADETPPSWPAIDVGQPPMGPVQSAEASSPEPLWESLIQFEEKEASRVPRPSVRPAQRPPWGGPSVAVAVLMLGLVVAWASGVLEVKTSDGVIVLENVPRDAEIFVDGKKTTFHRPTSRGAIAVRADAGQHKIKIRKSGFKAFEEAVTVKSDESKRLRVHLERVVAARPRK